MSGDIFVGIPAGDMSFKPGNTLFVAKSWPAGADPTKYFTDPAVALAFAITLAPTNVNPCVIIFYPGIYSQNLTLVSNVHLFGHNIKGTELSGAITYTPGSGVNAPQTNINERVYVGRLRITGAVSIDATGKAGDTSTFDTRNADLRGNFTFLGRAPGGQDFLQMWNGVHGGTTWSINGVVGNFNNGVTLGAGTVTLTNCSFGVEMIGVLCFSNLNLVNTPDVSGAGNVFAGTVNVDATSVFGPLPGSRCGTVNVTAGGKADLRGIEYQVLANIAGPGDTDRSVWRTTFGPTAVGANTVPITPPMIDANYNAILTLTAGAGVLTGITVTAKLKNQFTLTDPAGGHTFDITIIKE